ncbi:MAG: MATE family efflux transporter [Oscillospiraceae bacterium]|nr:MATE family efflux transporter [Oscillospiraceae bacterium]
MLQTLVGNKAFYRRIFRLMLPIMVQNGITNFVNMLDNIMIGTVGTAEMTGVALTNQLIFVFNLCIFGAVSGAGIFATQFFGSGDHEGVRHTFRFKMLFCGLITALGIALLAFQGEALLRLYMQGDGGVTDAVATMRCAKDYLAIMLIGLVPFTAVQCYAGTLRESGNPTPPMLAGVVAVLVNLVFNYILIFGHFGAPELGVCGAAIATVLSRFVELAILVIWAHGDTKTFPFMKGVYKSLYVPGKLVGQLFIKGLPLMINETLWASGIAVINQCYSTRGLDAVAAGNISQTFWNVFAIAYMAVGNAVGILLGQMLGAGKLKEAKESSYKMIAFSCAIAVCVGIVYSICAEFIPMAYNTEPEIRHLATRLMQITAIAMPFEALTHVSYFTLRSGGQMAITLVFDSGFMWCINVVLAVVLSRFTTLPFIWIFTAIQMTTVLKSVFGILLVRRGGWVRNITEA